MKKNMKKVISVFLAALMILSCSAVGAGASETECVHEYVLDDLMRPTKAADGTWGNGYATYVCKFNSKHQRNAVVARAQYDEYDLLVAQLNELMANPDIADVTRENIESVLATYGVADNLVILEQDQVNAAVANIRAATEKYMETYTVVFKDKDGNVLSEQTVGYGFAAVAPQAPVAEGFVFIGWDKDFGNVQSDLTVKALYKEGRAYIELSKKEIALKLGETTTVSAVVKTDEAIDANVVWSIGDSSVASVDANGTVKGLKSGYTTLTASILGGEVIASADVFVYDGQEEYTVQLFSAGMGSFVINGNYMTSGFIKVKSGSAFRFQFALSSMYDPANVSITANGKTVTLSEDNYFIIPYVCENMSVTVSLAGASEEEPDQPEQPEQPEQPADPTVPAGDSCWCHSSNGLYSFIWNMLMFFCKLLGVESYRYCDCGKAHW